MDWAASDRMMIVPQRSNRSKANGSALLYVLVLCRLEGDVCKLRRFVLASLIE